jgi:hypothetical protein
VLATGAVSRALLCALADEVVSTALFVFDASVTEYGEEVVVPVVVTPTVALIHSPLSQSLSAFSLVVLAVGVPDTSKADVALRRDIGSAGDVLSW